MAEDYNGTPLPDDQTPGSSNEDQNNNIPDWMKEAGWETSSGTFDESKPVFDDLDGEDEIVPADIPAWLEEAAPEGFSSDPDATPAFEGLDVDEPFITTGDLVPPPSMEPEAQEPEPDQPETPQKPSSEGEFDIPSWLDNLELDEDSQETAVAWLENMPESLRATEEELEAAREVSTEEPEIIEEPVDDLAWIDEVDLDQPGQEVENAQAELSEDLVASELIPEEIDPDKIFEQEEIESIESDLPSWLKELGDDQPEVVDFEETPAAPMVTEDAVPTETQDESLPDWLRTTEEPEVAETPPTPTPEPVVSESEQGTDIPDWLSDFEDSGPETEDEQDGLEWLDSLDTREAAPPTPAEEVVEETTLKEPDFPDLDSVESAEEEPATARDEFPDLAEVSPEDETLNAQVPEWLSNIGDESESEGVGLADRSDIPIPEDEFDSVDSWLEQIDESPGDTSQAGFESQEDLDLDWLEDSETLQKEYAADEMAEIQDTSITDSMEEPPADVDTSQYITEQGKEEETPEDLPDWLSELREEDGSDISLQEAIRESDHELNQEEVDFLNEVDQRQEEEADWLSKLEQDEGEADFLPPSPPLDLDSLTTDEPVEDHEDDPGAPGGMLDRLRESEDDGEVPHWLSDLKEEEDPQETAVLWLKQFVNQGDDIDIKDEIKRYTDELDPGDSIPKWMEDLKNEEDPQTTAMLWLERLAGQQAQSTPTPSQEEDDKGDSGWLAELEKEAADSTQEETVDEVKDFSDPDEGWLADLEIDEKIKTSEEDLPDWSKSEEETPESEPSWMKATSPLEGDFFTDELTGGEQQEADVPEWLAGYAEGEGPTELDQQDTEAEEEYTWLSATDAPAPTRSPLDLNKAAISQLESILGISHQIARGIVSYREKHGPYQSYSDLINVPEITDEQTIDILKPEVFISEVPLETDQLPADPIPQEEPAPPMPKPVKKPTKAENFEEMLVMARARISDQDISEATELYAALIKKKKFLDDIIDDLQKASLDHPLEISIQKTLGDAFMKIDKLDEALEAYSKAEDLLS